MTEPIIDCDAKDLADVQRLIRDVHQGGASVTRVSYISGLGNNNGTNLSIETNWPTASQPPYDPIELAKAQAWREELMRIATACNIQFERCIALKDENNQKSARNFRSIADTIHRILGTGLGADADLLYGEDGQPQVRRKDDNLEVVGDIAAGEGLPE